MSLKFLLATQKYCFFYQAKSRLFRLSPISLKMLHTQYHFFVHVFVAKFQQNVTT
eukprot:UN00610